MSTTYGDDKASVTRYFGGKIHGTCVQINARSIGTWGTRREAALSIPIDDAREIARLLTKLLAEH